MEKSILKRFKRAGKNAIATALVLGLGSGVFAGCENNMDDMFNKGEFNTDGEVNVDDNLYQLNDEMYQKFFVSEDSKFRLSEEDYELAKECEEVLTELFSNEKYFGGMVGDFDSITLVSPKFGDAYYSNIMGIENDDAFLIRTFNDGLVTDYSLVVPDGYIEELDADVFNDNYKTIPHAYAYINKIKDLIDSGTLTKDDFKLICFDSDAEKIVRHAIEDEVLKAVRNNENIKTCIDAGYDLYIMPFERGDIFNYFNFVSFYEQETADLNFKYVVFGVNSMNFVVDIYQPLNGKGQTDVKVSVLPMYNIIGIDDYGRDINTMREYGIDFDVRDEKAKQNIITLIEQFLEELKKTEMYEQSSTNPYDVTGYMFESHGMSGVLNICRIDNNQDFYNYIYSNAIAPIFELAKNGRNTFHNEDIEGIYSTVTENDFYLYDIVEGKYNNSCILSNKESRPKDESNTWIRELGIED